MNKVLKRCIFVCLLGWSLNLSAQQEQTFSHTIEQGQTVYAIATMYGVTPEAIYKLNPGSKEGIKAGKVLLIPKRPASFTEGEETETYTFHTIERKETLYAVSMKYKVPAQYIIDANPGLSTKTFTTGKTIRIPLSKSVDRKKTTVQIPLSKWDCLWTGTASLLHMTFSLEMNLKKSICGRS